MPTRSIISANTTGTQKRGSRTGPGTVPQQPPPSGQEFGAGGTVTVGQDQQVQPNRLAQSGIQPARPRFFNPVGATPQTVSNIQSRQQGLLGELGQVFPQRGFVRASDIPALEANLNFQERLNSLQDRALGVGELRQGLADARGDPGFNTAEGEAAALATGRAGPFSQNETLRREQAIRAQANLDNRAAQRDLSQRFTQQGISGGATALDSALLEQAGRQQLQQTLAENALQEAVERQAAREFGIGQLSQIAERRAALEFAAQQALADAFLGTERTPFDFSGLTVPVPEGARPIGF